MVLIYSCYANILHLCPHGVLLGPELCLEREYISQPDPHGNKKDSTV